MWGGGADSGSEAKPIALGGNEVVFDSDPEDVPLVAERWCDNVNPQEATTSAIDLHPIQNGHSRYNAITMPLPDQHDLGMLARRFNWGFDSDAVSPHRLCKALSSLHVACTATESRCKIVTSTYPNSAASGWSSGSRTPATPATKVGCFTANGRRVECAAAPRKVARSCLRGPRRSERAWTAACEQGKV